LIDCVKNIAEMVTTSDGNSITASQFLNKFGFAPKVQNTQIGKLSGGEKRRLQLLLILIKNPNFLILDEPTNDLDLMTLNVLEEFLDEFSGCLILVSHDRYFMDRLVEHIFVFQGEGIIKDFPGNYTDYREELIEEKKNESKTEIIPTKIKEEKKEIDVPKIKLSFKEQKQLEAIPLEIEKLEKRKEEINQLFLTNLSREELEKFGEEMQKIVSKIEENEMIWLELSER